MKLQSKKQLSNVVVEIQSGKVRGTTGQDYHGGKLYKFLGIPYAKSPTGPLRFKAPQPVEPWTDIKDATKEGPECPSSDMYFIYFVGNEDNCLNLNVYTKELPQSDDKPLKKPVMVWIHGGAFTTGSNKSSMYGPDYLLTQDIVLVAINYRLGILGFASFEDQTLEVPGNAGLKDMRMALKWVQQNITKFGGDPDNVTIFGESAGGASVHYLTLAPSTQGLFHKAIVQSGSALNNWAWGHNNSKQIAKMMGYKDCDEKKILEKLMKEPARNLVSGQRRIKEKFSAGEIRPLGPVVEPPSPDAILTEHPNKIMHSQGGHKIPIIIGYNSHEGMLFELVRKTIPGVTLPQNLEHDIPYELGLEKGTKRAQEVSDRLKKAYFNDTEHLNEDDIDQVYRFKGDVNFVYPIQKVIKLQAKHSHQPVYAYRMSVQTPLNYFHTFAMNKYFKTAILCSFLSKLSNNYLPSAKESVLGMLQKLPKREIQGVAHADDLFYLFPTFFTPQIKIGSEEDKHIQRFVKMWTNFAKYGKPTTENDEHLNVQWKPTSHDNVEFLDIGHELEMIRNIDEDRLKVWDEIYEEYLKI